VSEPSSVIQVACPPAPDGCGAAVGARCVTKSGAPASKFHRARYAATGEILPRYMDERGEVPMPDGSIVRVEHKTQNPEQLELQAEVYRAAMNTPPPTPRIVDKPYSPSKLELANQRARERLMRYEPTEFDIEEFLSNYELHQRPTREEARAFLTMYANGDLDGLTTAEVIEKLKAANENFIYSITEEWDRLNRSISTSFSDSRGPFRQATATKKKSGKFNARRAKNRIAKATKKKQRRKK